MRRLLVAAVVLVAAVSALPASVANAAYKYLPLSINLESHTEPLAFVIEHIAEYECNDGSIEVESVEVNGNPVTPVSVTPDAGDPNAASVVLPSDTTPGTVVVVSTCTVGEGGTVYALGETSFAALAVTKVVEGPVPSDASFTVHGDCVPRVRPDSVEGTVDLPDPGPFAVDLVYGPSGGKKYVYAEQPVLCTLTEPVTGGAASVTITPETVEMYSPTAFAATVTNVFPAAAVVAQPNFPG
jgi:hypothetical protein